MKPVVDDKNKYDDLIAHLDEVVRVANDDLTEIAIEAMESNESGPFGSRLVEEQKRYQSEKQRVLGTIDVVEEVKAFAEWRYGDE